MKTSIDVHEMIEWYKDSTNFTHDNFAVMVIHFDMRSYLDRERLERPIGNTKRFYLTPIGVDAYQKYLLDKKLDNN